MCILARSFRPCFCDRYTAGARAILGGGNLDITALKNKGSYFSSQLQCFSQIINAYLLFQAFWLPQIDE